MKNVLSFWFNESKQEDNVFLTWYNDFLDFAFTQSDYFMLVYVNWYGEGFSDKMHFYMEKFKPYKVKTRTNPTWPGTRFTESKNTRYKVCFYRTVEHAKKILKLEDSIFNFTPPNSPQDLAFFKGNDCWFFSVGHEKIMGFLNPTNFDMEFLVSHNIVNKKDIDIKSTNFFDYCDEKLET